MKGREDRFIPIYTSLVDPHSAAGDLNCLDATLLVAMNSNATIEQKVLFAFTAFDFFKRRALTFDAVVALISTVVRTIERVGEGVGEDEEDIEARRVASSGKIGTNVKPRSKFSDEEVDNLVMLAFIEMGVKFNKMLTLLDFTKWSKDLIVRNEDLSDAFRVSWKFSTLQKEATAFATASTCAGVAAVGDLSSGRGITPFVWNDRNLHCTRTSVPSGRWHHY